jgi:hypothetical protein
MKKLVQYREASQQQQDQLYAVLTHSVDYLEMERAIFEQMGGFVDKQGGIDFNDENSDQSQIDEIQNKQYHFVVKTAAELGMSMQWDDEAVEIVEELEDALQEKIAAEIIAERNRK